MSRILIPTHLGDLHALAVSHVLESRGHEVVLWFGSDYPTRQSASVFLSGPEGVSWEVEGPGLRMTAEPFDTVWMRRPSLPVLPAGMHSGDRRVAEREGQAFLGSLWPLISPAAFWVNPLPARQRAGGKAMQLAVAREVGMPIPETLLSNDPGQIRRFLRRHEGEAVFKSFLPNQWRTEDGAAMLYTTALTEADLPEDDVLRLCPGIFQRRVAKAYELRVAFLGHEAMTAKLYSQESTATRTDWKEDAAHLRVEPARLPEATELACRRFMDRLGLVFGCFDFIVTPEGEHVFVEVNEMGQFLWVEELAPDLPLLAAFCDFLLAGRPDFRFSAPAEPVRFLELRDLLMRENERLTFLHREGPKAHLFSDAETGPQAFDRSYRAVS